ncbi:hypothetical protein J6590_072972 [Homalodisca vitripennis]|nr:hypothetical protein J6590_072972 [Homalodisca vitripennis]
MNRATTSPPVVSRHNRRLSDKYVKLGLLSDNCCSPETVRSTGFSLAFALGFYYSQTDGHYIYPMRTIKRHSFQQQVCNSEQYHTPAQMTSHSLSTSPPECSEFLIRAVL